MLLPLALPGVIGALRIGTGMSIVAVIVGEMIVSVYGIGNWISRHRTTFDTPDVYAGIVVVLIFALVINYAMVRLGRLATRHRGAT